MIWTRRQVLQGLAASGLLTGIGLPSPAQATRAVHAGPPGWWIDDAWRPAPVPDPDGTVRLSTLAADAGWPMVALDLALPMPGCDHPMVLPLRWLADAGFRWEPAAGRLTRDPALGEAWLRLPRGLWLHPPAPVAREDALLRPCEGPCWLLPDGGRDAVTADAWRALIDRGVA
jgi:hypothetical protein